MFHNTPFVMDLHNLFRNVKNSSGLQSNQITKGLDSNQNNKTRLNYRVLQDTKYSNLKCNKIEKIVETKYNVKNNVDEINLRYKNKSHKHCIIDYNVAKFCKHFIVSNLQKSRTIVQCKNRRLSN